MSKAGLGKIKLLGIIGTTIVFLQLKVVQQSSKKSKLIKSFFCYPPCPNPGEISSEFFESNISKIQVLDNKTSIKFGSKLNT